MKLDHVVIAASDLERSAAWWSAVMAAVGFGATRQWVWVNAQGIAIDLRQAQEPEHAYQRFGPGVNHLAVAAPSREAVDTVRAAVAEAGFDVPALQHFGESVALFLRDPDGLRLEVAWEAEAA